MCIQCLDASAFGKEVYCMYCRFVPRNTWKGACVPLPVSAEWCLAAHRLCRAGSSLGKHEPCSYGKGLWRNVTVPQVVSITTVVFCSFQAPPFNFSFFFFYSSRRYSAASVFIRQYFCDLFFPECIPLTAGDVVLHRCFVFWLYAFQIYWACSCYLWIFLQGHICFILGELCVFFCSASFHGARKLTGACVL